jgi:hypothetical protein
MGYAVHVEEMMRNIANFLLLGVVLTLVLNGCNTVPPPTATTVAITPATISPTPISVPKGENIIVTSANDSGNGTLQQALTDAQPGDIITFDPSVFPPDNPTTIVLTNGLPEINQGYLTIDASNAGVILDGCKITTPESVHGLSITSNNNIVRGLQITGFSDAGIALYNSAQYNLIGGDREIGDGPLGQGNSISGNANFGIGLWEEGTSHNTIQGNYIGVMLDNTVKGQGRDGIHSNGSTENLITDNVIGGNDVGVYLCCAAEGRNTVTDNFIGLGPTGTMPLPNNTAGILVDRSSYNVVGPGNVIAQNTGQGIAFWSETSHNTLTQNSIHDNGELGINLRLASVTKVSTPLIFEYDLQTGNLTGWTCPGCTVEVFSDVEDEGADYEGQVVADSNGNFTFKKGTAFTKAHVTLTTTDTEGNTSAFSTPIMGKKLSPNLQTGNKSLKTGIVPRKFGGLADNRIGDTFPLDRYPSPCPPANEDWSFTHVGNLGLKWVRLSLDRLELDQARSMEDYSQFEINECQDEIVSLLAENDITILYTLVYWDENLHTENYPDYKNEEEIKRFLDYTRLIVRHFKGRIQYYEILNEALVYVEAADYVKLIHRVIPVIREEDPEAKIVVGGATDLRHDYSREYLFNVLRSDIMPLVDAIAVHSMYGVSPQYDETRQYYENYPLMIQEIKKTASANGFNGEFFAEEMSWRTAINPNPYEPGGYTSVVAAKYYARSILMNRGLDLWAGLAGEMYDTIPPVVTIIQNLGTTMSGVKPDNLDVKIESEAGNNVSYGFSLPNGDWLLALWTNGAAIDDDPGVNTTIIFPDLSAEKVVGIDVLNGYKQELVSSNQNGSLVIRDVLIMDYPIIIQVSK